MLPELVTSLMFFSSSTLKMDAKISSERPVNFNGLHGTATQQTELFIEVLLVS